jgi:UDP-glucose 4-epimerase
MKYIVIGSKGFIGSHCIDFFRQRSDTVYGCDVVVDYTDEQYFLLDATNADFKEIFENHQFDICINCAGAASVPDSIKHPRRDFELNVHLAFSLLDAIRHYAPACKFIHFSSAATYGNPVTLPLKEDSLLAPVSPYGWHKLYSEQVCKEFVSFYNSKIAILRPFSVYGSGLKKQLFWDVYQKMKKGQPFQLFGTGNETRDFIHISDLLNLVDLIIQKGMFNGEVYNAANGESVTIREVIDIFVAHTTSAVTYSFNNEVKAGDPLFWQADIDKIRSLGYTQKMSLTEGLQEYIQWAAQNV